MISDSGNRANVYLRVFGQVFIAAFGLFWVVASAPIFANGSDRWVKDPIEISKIVHAIPVYNGDLGGRLAAAGLTVEAIHISNISREDVAEDPLHLALHDVELTFLTKGDPQAGDCVILGQPAILKRGSRYLPQDRTGMWLLTGKCEVPD